MTMIDYSYIPIFDAIINQQSQHIVIWITICLFGLVILYSQYKINKRISQLRG